MGKLKVGIVGAGGIFEYAHAKPWLSHADTEIVAICDQNREQAERMSKKYHIEKIYVDYTEMLRDMELDIVDICTPNLYHSEIAIAALQAGVHVFCEKPDAVNPEEAIRMAEEAEKQGKTLMVMRNNRFSPPSKFMKQYIEEGHMGEIYTGRCGWIRRRGIPGKGGWFTTKALSGGGPLIDLGVHMIDLAVWLMGSPKPVSVSGAMYTKFADSDLNDSSHGEFGNKSEDGTFDVEDLATGFIRFDNGATLQIEFSWASNIEEEMYFYELRGTKAGAKYVEGELKIFNEICGTLCDLTPRFTESNKGDHERNIHHFIDVIQGRDEPLFVPAEGVDMIKILDAIYESARLGKEIVL